MIIWGIKTIESTASTGMFSCPRCQTAQPCRWLAHNRWFTLYFIPLIPLGRAGEQVECQGCFSRFSPDVMSRGSSDEPLMAILVDGPAAMSKPWMPQPKAPPRTSGLAVTSLVLGLLSPLLLCVCGISLFSSLGAIVSGHVALLMIRRSLGQLAGRGMAISGLALGYLLFIVSAGAWVMFAPAVYQGWSESSERQAQAFQTPEDRLQAAELAVLSHGASGVASGNTPEAKQLAADYSQGLKVLRDAVFSADRDRIVSLTRGQFLVHCELRPGRCAFLVHVPSYRDFSTEAKGALENTAWQLAQQLVEETLAPDDSLAVGLRGALLYGAVLVGPAGSDEANPNNFTREERDALLAFFAEEDSLFDPAAEMGDPLPSAVAEPDHDDASPEEADPFAVIDEVRDFGTFAIPSEVTEPAAPATFTPQRDPDSDLPVAAVVHQFPNMGWTVESLAFAPGSGLLGAGKLDSTLAVFDVESGEQRHSEPRQDDLGQIKALAFSFDGERLFAGGYRGPIQMWSVSESGELSGATKLHGHAKQVTALTASPVSRFVLSGSAAGDLVWQAYDPPSQAPRTLAAFERSALAAHLPRSGMEAWATDGRRLIRFDLRKGEITKTLDLGRGSVQAAAFSGDGNQLALVMGNAIAVWDTERGVEIAKLKANKTQWSVALLSDGRGVISGGQGRATFWRLTDGEPFARLDLDGIQYLQTLAVSQDERLLAAIPASAGQTLTVAQVPELP